MSSSESDQDTSYHNQELDDSKQESGNESRDNNDTNQDYDNNNQENDDENQDLDNSNQKSDNENQSYDDSNQDGAGNIQVLVDNYDDDLAQEIRHINYDSNVDSLTEYFTSIPKIRDCVVSLVDQNEKKHDSLSKNICDFVTKTITDTLNKSFNAIFNEAFHNNEIQEFQSNNLADCAPAKWINEHLRNLRFVQIVSFFDSVFNHLISLGLISANSIPTRAAKREREAFYDHLNSWWNELEPLLNNYIAVDITNEFINKAENDFKLINKK